MPLVIRGAEAYRAVPPVAPPGSGLEDAGERFAQ